MPLSVLHEYRAVYNLPCPSAFSSEISAILLSQGVGLRSPTAIAARRAQAATNRRKSAKHSQHQQSSSNAVEKPGEDAVAVESQSTTRMDVDETQKENSTTNDSTAATADNNSKDQSSSIPDPHLSSSQLDILHRISGAPASHTSSSRNNGHNHVHGQQGRVTKAHLANTVRKHFNGVALVEQDAIARFLYKVREERKGREFRLRFQP